MLGIMSDGNWHLYSLVPAAIPVTHKDCLHIADTWYCRKSNDFFSECKGRPLSFIQLRDRNVSADQLLEWLIPVETVDVYAQMKSADNFRFICNCSKGWFGSSCTFTLPTVSPLQEYLSQLLDNTQVIQTSICYNELNVQCDSGPYCLDWRSVCDGIRQCADGQDEINCERLEGNSCESDEFRCRNGACIPAEFVFDGQFDCQDLSDEHHLYRFNNCHKRLDLECDERLCNSDEPFSCGDGQCLAWQHLLDNTPTCVTLRDLFYRCELHRSMQLYTGDKGICATAAVNAVFDENNPCEIIFRKLMTIGGARNLSDFEQHCPSIITYPKVDWLAKNIFTAYEKSKLRSLIVNKTYYYHIGKDDRMPHLLCKENVTDCRLVSKLLHEPGTIFPFDRLAEPTANQVGFYRCRNSTRLIHDRRLNDGHIDCMFGDDELRSDVVPSEKYRYRCASASPIQYVRTQLVGDGVRDCKDGSDELSPNVNWARFRCTREENYACATLRSPDGIARAKPQFHRLCDSLWDTAGGLGDEFNCSMWRCPKHLIACNRTGQCISDKWRCDWELDCADGEDEHGPDCSKKPFTLADMCDRKKEYFCVTDAYARQPDQFRPCISYDQVGDRHIDCLGGYDESNTLACPHDGDMLRRRFLCSNGTCIDGAKVCNCVDDCQGRDDERICVWNNYQNRYDLE